MEKKRPRILIKGERGEMFKTWLSPPGITFKNPETEQMYRERITRINDVIELKVPDRIPVYLSSGFFPAYYAGISPREAMYEYDKFCAAWEKHAFDFEADVYGSSSIVGPGMAYEILDYKLYRWPGHGIRADAPYQCVEAEYMKEDEYDKLIQDPSDFWLRTYLPRIFGELEPLKKLSTFTSVVEMPFTGAYFLPYGMPDINASFEALLSAGQEATRWRKAVARCDKVVMESGFPIFRGGATKAPFDTLGDTLRGTRGIMMDMYRQPEKLIEAMEKLTPLMLEMGVSGTRSSGNPIVFIPLHKGADGFLSNEQYKTFYWPTLKKVILGLIDEGLVPLVFAEGAYDTRLDIIQDIPKGSTIWQFDYTDMAKAKEVLGNTACIAGNVPISLLSTGTPDEVKVYCKKLIDVAGKDGGFILAPGASIDNVRPENLREMVNFTKEYGIYS